MKWISIKDELPPFGRGLLITNGIIVTAAERYDYIDGKVGWTGHEINGAEWEFDFDDETITYWMLLPKPPGLQGVQP